MKAGVASGAQRRLVGGGEAPIAAENFCTFGLLVRERGRRDLHRGDIHFSEREGRDWHCSRCDRWGAANGANLLSRGPCGRRSAELSGSHKAARPPETAAEQQRERRDQEEEVLWGEVSHASPSGSVVRTIVR